MPHEGFKGPHREETKRRISKGMKRHIKNAGVSGFQLSTNCPNCGAPMSPANVGRHIRSCREISSIMERYPDLFLKRPSYPAFKQLQQMLRSGYGLTLEQYAEMHAEQNGCCAICGSPSNRQRHRLSVDHCHETGKVRGLLCDGCNTMLGYAQDNPQILRAAAEYLEQHKD